MGRTSALRSRTCRHDGVHVFVGHNCSHKEKRNAPRGELAYCSTFFHLSSFGGFRQSRKWGQPCSLQHEFLYWESSPYRRGTGRGYAPGRHFVPFRRSPALPLLMWIVAKLYTIYDFELAVRAQLSSDRPWSLVNPLLALNNPSHPRNSLSPLPSLFDDQYW